MSEARDPSAQSPTPGEQPLPDRPAPAPAPASTPSPSPGPSPAPGPGDVDLPWKATAERRDLWGPVEKPLEGTVRPPATQGAARTRRSPFVRFGVPVLIGAVLGAGTIAVGLAAAIASPLLVLGAGVGVGVLALGGSGVALNAGGGARRIEAGPVLASTVPDSTRTVLERILAADATSRGRVAALRPQAAGVAAATRVLDDVDKLLTRIDALVGTEQIQGLRPSSGEVTMLEGIAVRYTPELLDAASDVVGFLQTFAGTARQEALANLESVDRQLAVLSEGVERIESDVLGGVSRDLEVHAEFLRTRFADQHLNPIIDV
ncbi:hypothetical protein ACXET9_07490 [Brachybacterium sp. DNPG3]